MIVTIVFFWYVMGFIATCLVALIDEELKINTIVFTMSLWFCVFIMALDYISWDKIVYKSKKKQVEEIMYRDI